VALAGPPPSQTPPRGITAVGFLR